MKIFAHQAAWQRIRNQLPALGLPLEFITLDGKGVYRAGDTVIEAAAVKPDIVWLSFDALFGGQINLFFDAILNSGTVKWVQTANTGLDSPRYRDVYDRGIPLTNSHAQAVAIAEYVLANVMAELRHIDQQFQAQRDGKWYRAPFRELSQSRWLILGFGAIGQEIARRAIAFGSKITAIGRTAKPHALADDVGTPADLPRLLPAADIVVIAATLTDTTKDLANAEFFAAMKPGSLIVNVARGGIVVDEALLAALDRGAPGAAILDVFREEPLPAGHPYWTHPKVRVTGHTSSAGNGTQARGDHLFLANLQRFAKGEDLLNVVTERSF